MRVSVSNPMLDDEAMEAMMKLVDYLADERQEYASLQPEERPGHIYHAVLQLLSSGLCLPEGFEDAVQTPGAAAAITKANQEPWEFLCRHHAGDWGNVCFEDWMENDVALENGGRLFSSYQTHAGDCLWVITEADRSVTTILLPEEY